MTREEAEQTLRRLDAGVLSVSERAQLIDHMLAFLLRAALQSPSGSVTIDLSQLPAPRVALKALTDDHVRLMDMGD